MLQYLTTGSCYFGKTPQHPTSRRGWEFYAVVKGKIAPWFPEKEPLPTLHSERLWLLPPESCHGWIGEGEKAARIVVFHFDALPPQLNRFVPPPEHISVSLTPAEGNWIRQLAQEHLPRFWQGGPLLALYSDRLLLDITLLMLEKLSPSVSPQTTPAASPSAQIKVEIAEQWFRTNLKEGPSFSDMARSTGTTEGHLRRLFWTVRQRSPKTIMNQIQIEHAQQLLKTTEEKLEAIAKECGFLDSSRMCKTFKKEAGITPNQYRKQNR